MANHAEGLKPLHEKYGAILMRYSIIFCKIFYNEMCLGPADGNKNLVT
jgi:hypothetical protein